MKPSYLFARIPLPSLRAPGKRRLLLSLALFLSMLCQIAGVRASSHPGHALMCMSTVPNSTNSVWHFHQILCEETVRIYRRQTIGGQSNPTSCQPAIVGTGKSSDGTNLFFKIVPTDSQSGFPTKICIEWEDGDRQRSSGYDTCANHPTDCGTKTDGITLFSPPALPSGSFEFSHSVINVGEGRSVDFRIRLTVQPSSNVTVTLDHDTDLNSIAYDKTTLTFTTSNWSTWQTIKISAPADDDGSNHSDTVTFSATGGIVEFERNLTVNAFDHPQGTINVTPSGALALDEGNNSTFTVALSRRPNRRATTVSITSGDSGAVSVSPTELVFYNTGTNWSTAESVTVTAVQENSDYADETVDITVAIANGGLVAPAVTKRVTVSDDDSPPGNITISPSGTLALDEGSTGTFTVKLDTMPNRDVTVSITSADTGAVSVSPSSLSFNSSNYGMERTVTVTAVQENNDYAHENVTITLSATGGIDASNVTKRVTVNDDDTPPGNIEATPSSIDLYEGSDDIFTVALDTMPNRDVLVSIVSDDTGAATITPSSLRFNSSNYNTGRPVIITSVQDADTDHEDVTITLSATGGIDANDLTVAVAVEDDEVPSGNLTVTPLALDIDEGATGTFTVKLDTRPSRLIVVSVSSDDTGAATVSPASLNFTSDNYSTAQTVTVTAVQDSDYSHEEVAIAVSASGGFTANATVTVSVDDDENPSGIIVIRPSGPLALEEGGSGTFDISLGLGTAPSENVIVSVAGNDDGVRVSPTRLTFTPSNYNTAQRVTVTAVQDADHADEDVDITLSATGGIAASNLTKQVTVSDDDIPSGSLTMAPTGPLTLGEGSQSQGQSDTFTVALSAEPKEDAVIALSSGDAGAVKVSPARLTFTSSNYNIAQTVSVNAVDDDDTNDESTSITLVPSGGIDARDQTIAVRVVDDDWKIVLSPSRPLRIVEGGSGSFDVALDNAPPADISIALASDHPDVTVLPTVLEFSQTNFDSPQRVSIGAAKDEDEDYETATITLAPPGNSLVSPVRKSVLVSDFDITSITRPEPETEEGPPYEGTISVFPTRELVIAQGSPGTFSVALDERPVANVSVRVSKNPFDITLSPSSLTFTVDNYDRPRFVIVTAGKNDEPFDTPYSITFSAGDAPLVTRKVIVGGSAGRVRTLALALPPSGSKDSATLRVRCNQDSPCALAFDCSTQNYGSGLRGRLPDMIPAMSTWTFTAAEVEKYIGGSWSGKGRLGCSLLSDGNISSQVWTRSGDGVLVNNSALVRSAPDAEGVHRADIETIPSPDSSDESNLRLRCSSLVSDCRDTKIRCYDDTGTKYEAILRAILRGATRHLQAEELASLIGHRWEGLGLSCEISSAAQFTVQVLTRTGGGGALVNNSQSSGAVR